MVPEAFELARLSPSGSVRAAVPLSNTETSEPEAVVARNGAHSRPRSFGSLLRSNATSLRLLTEPGPAPGRREDAPALFGFTPRVGLSEHEHEVRHGIWRKQHLVAAGRRGRPGAPPTPSLSSSRCSTLLEWISPKSGVPLPVHAERASCAVAGDELNLSRRLHVAQPGSCRAPQVGGGDRVLGEPGDHLSRLTGHGRKPRRAPRALRSGPRGRCDRGGSSKSGEVPPSISVAASSAGGAVLGVRLCGGEQLCHVDTPLRLAIPDRMPRLAARTMRMTVTRLWSRTPLVVIGVDGEAEVGLARVLDDDDAAAGAEAESAVSTT